MSALTGAVGEFAEMEPVTIAATAALVVKCVLPAIRSLGEKVLEKSEDAASDAAVGFGKRLLQLLLDRPRPIDRSDAEIAVLERGIKRRVLALAQEPEQPDAPIQLTGVVEELLHADPGLLASVAELLKARPAESSGGIHVGGNVTDSSIISNSTITAPVMFGDNIHYQVGEDQNALAAKHFEAGRRHLELGLFSEAAEDFRLSRLNAAENPDAYFLGAVAMLGGHKAFRASLQRVREIERLIHSAIALQDRPVFHYFLAYVRYDYYERKSLNPPAPWQVSFVHAWNKGLTQGEIDELFRWLSVENPLPPPR